MYDEDESETQDKSSHIIDLQNGTLKEGDIIMISSFFHFVGELTVTLDVEYT